MKGVLSTLVTDRLHSCTSTHEELPKRLSEISTFLLHSITHEHRQRQWYELTEFIEIYKSIKNDVEACSYRILFFFLR